MSINYRYRLKAIKIICKGKNSASKETVSLVVKETVDIDMLITSANFLIGFTYLKATKLLKGQRLFLASKPP